MSPTPLSPAYRNGLGIRFLYHSSVVISVSSQLSDAHIHKSSPHLRATVVGRVNWTRACWERFAHMRRWFAGQTPVPVAIVPMLFHLYTGTNDTNFTQPFDCFQFACVTHATTHHHTITMGWEGKTLPQLSLRIRKQGSICIRNKIEQNCPQNRWKKVANCTGCKRLK